MKKSDVLSYWGSPGAAARAYGRHKSIVNSWGDIVPEQVATKMHILTEGTPGALIYDPSVYESMKTSPNQQTRGKNNA